LTASGGAARRDPEPAPREPGIILLVINGTDFGGTESALLQLAEKLMRRGHGVHVLSIKPPGRIAEIMRGQGIPVSTLGMDEKVTSWNLLSGSWRMARMLRRGSYSVVHSFLPRANIMSRIANRFTSPRIPHLSSERSTDFRRSRLVQRLNRHTSRWTDLVLAVTPAVQRMVVERDGLDPAKVVLLQNGIDIERVDRRPRAGVREELGLEGKTTLIGSAGRLIQDKGHAYLIQAFARIASGRPSLHLVLAGDGPENGRLRTIAREAGMEGRVHFLGYRDDVIGILKDMDIFVLPSLEEGISVVLLEAMACGLPIIATEVGGIPGVITHGETGLLVPPAEQWAGEAGGPSVPDRGAGSARELAQRGISALERALERVIDDRVFSRRLGQAGRARVESEFSIERVVSRVEECYRMAGAELVQQRIIEPSGSSGPSR
jgi:glycosyltransferase involved in cell wall biosynthesis